MTEAKRVKRRRKAAVAAAALLFLSFLPPLPEGNFPRARESASKREAGVAGRPTDRDRSIIEPRRREGRGERRGKDDDFPTV